MKITFLGATKTVTGSNYLVEAAGKKFLVDCGMWQGRKELEEENFQEFDFNYNCYEKNEKRRIKILFFKHLRHQDSQ